MELLINSKENKNWEVDDQQSGRRFTGIMGGQLPSKLEESNIKSQLGSHMISEKPLDGALESPDEYQTLLPRKTDEKDMIRGESEITEINLQKESHIYEGKFAN